ncbi:MAG: DAK2 domain-containing protein [Clostridia bacterium]|nr:DAK2 domain-containing protein [Clostridia bacterium]
MDNTLSKRIDGELFEKIVESGARNLKLNLQVVNDLNVFPVPDGDTGDNMYMTMQGGIKGLKSVQDNSVCKKAKALADGMLLNARGNSGVILSQLFAGISEGLADCNEASVADLGKAFNSGVCKAYKAVSNPVEGTILTVAREATAFACENCDKQCTVGKFFENYTSEMKASLERTPELLSVLKEAGVTDSGGAGLVYIAEGMKSAIEGKEIEVVESAEKTVNEIDFSLFNENSVMEYGYCTELLLQLTNAKGDVSSFDLEALKMFLEGVGDSVVCFITGSVVKLHVHTLTPDKVLAYCLNYGEFLTVKIENMSIQHSEVKKQEKPEAKKARPRSKFGLVTVATGEGLINVFKELGADEVIDGGQGKNPSIERFVEAFDYVNADVIYVLPNNSNIIMAAKQASEMYKKSQIVVIETKDVGQAYNVLSMLDYSSEDAEQIAEQMRSDMKDVVTGMITTSIRDANIDGIDIKNGDYIGFAGKTMLTANKNKIESFFALADKLEAWNKNFMIVSFGENVTEDEKQAIENKIVSEHSSLEFYRIDGGQEVYDFIMILE